MPSDINRRFAKRVRELRERRRLTQQQLAELADIEYKHVQALESSRPPSPRLETIEKLARALRMTCSKLLDF
jgi:transcriptional regulator with XRE-family HTH domain